MNSIVPIRQAHENDLAALSALAIKTFYDTFKGTAEESDFAVAMPAWFAPERMLEKLTDPANEAYVAENNGALIAYAIFRQGTPPFPAVASNGFELMNLYVDAPWHGQGVAQALMQLFYARAAAMRLQFLWLGVWEHNYRAQRFYAKEGFQYSGHDHPFPIHNTPQTDQWWVKMLE